MKNYIQPGDTLGFTAPAGGVVSGNGVLVGDMFGVAAVSAAVGETFQLKTTGVFDLPKTSAQAWSEGQKLYWSSANSEVSTTATGNKLIGVATEVAVNPSSLGRVRLNGTNS